MLDHFLIGPNSILVVFHVLVSFAVLFGAAACQGLMDVSILTATPVVLGVLTCTEEEQAVKRSTGDNNHGRDWGKPQLMLLLLLLLLLLLRCCCWWPGCPRLLLLPACRMLLLKAVPWRGAVAAAVRAVFCVMIGPSGWPFVPVYRAPSSKFSSRSLFSRRRLLLAGVLFWTKS